jgi:hypothetical protein
MHVQASYTLGDSDSRLSARQAIYESLRMNATEQAQTFVLKTQSLDEGGYSEALEVVTSALVSLENYEERFDGAKGRNGILVATAQAEIDDSELRSRVQAMTDEQVNKRLLQKVVSENRRLRRELSGIQSSGDSTFELSINGLEKRANLYKSLSKNRSETAHVFAPGELLNIAAMADSEMDRAKTSIEKALLERIQSVPIRSAVAKVSQKQSGVEVMVDVAWHLPLADLDSDIQRLRAEKKGSTVEYRSKDAKQDTISPDLYKWLSKQAIYAEIELSGEVRRIPVFYAAQNFFLDRSCTDPDEMGQEAIDSGLYILCAVSSADAVLDDNGHVTFTLTQQQATGASELKAKMVREEI